MSDVALIEYLYGTYTGEDLDGQVVTRVIPFRVTKKTPKRVFYVADWIHGTTARLGSVDRQQLEQAGEVRNRARGWWEPDYLLTAEPPQMETRRLDPAALKAELDRLRTEMAAAHPDHGGTAADFIAAQKRFAVARNLFRRTLAARPAATQDGPPDTRPVPSTPNHTDRGDTA